ncbi:MAG: 1-acyl-sn-glycerol-3-phosphate acyltransferase [Isosphaeraceae bacterium]
MNAQAAETPTVPTPETAAPPRSHVAPWLWWSLRPIHWALMRYYFRTKVTGWERMPKKGPVIICPTHRSRWDTLALYCSIKRPLRFLTTRDEFLGAQNWVMRRMGAFPVNTQRPEPGVMKHCRDLLMAGQPLVIFPEGALYYYPPDHVHPIKPGAAWIALVCQEKLPDTPLSIVPVRLKYGERILKFRSRIEVEVRPPIALAPYMEIPKKQAIRQLTADIQAALGDVVSEAPADVPVPDDGPPDPVRS